jgi:hypothetical protein
MGELSQMRSERWERMLRRCCEMVGLILLILSVALHAAEPTAGGEPLLEGAPVSKWLAEIGSEAFGRRERASEVLSKADSSIAPQVKALLEKSEDPEVKQRLTAVLAAIKEIDIGRTFYLHDSHVTSGEQTIAGNAEAEGTLEITPGKIVFVQKYDGKTVMQTYLFDEKTRLKAKGPVEVHLTFDEMNSTDENYSADDKNAKLSAKNTPQGALVVLQATDQSNSTGIWTFKATPRPKVQEP